MPDPKDVFNHPLQHLDFLQSSGFEGQYFDRKEIPTAPPRGLKGRIRACISAFANTNLSGGLLVLGIADDGTIRGTQDVDERTMNGILQAIQELSNHATQTREVGVPNSEGKRLHLLYTPWSERAICETRTDSPQAWKRIGAQNIVLSQTDRDQLKRDKQIVDFEMSYCCDYDADELDKGLVEEFKKIFIEEREAQYEHSLEEILFNAGALIKNERGYAFTNAGYLFFTANPRKRFESAFVRLLRYDVSANDLKNNGGTTFDKDFDGALPNIIRNLRTFLRDSAFSRKFSKRNPDGGFTDEPEYPLIAVDEALVNAIIHRDYGAPTPTLCIAYRDALLVKSPGKIPQRVPQRFSLDETSLDSVPRNQKIVGWMRLLKDERGSAFVRALSEGTRTMHQEMEKLGLPAPTYETNASTTVTLQNNIEERLQKYVLSTSTETQEFANLFPLELSGRSLSRDEFQDLRGNMLTSIKDALFGHGWFIDRSSFGRLIAHRKGNALPLSPQVERVARIYPAYEFQVRQYAQNLYLCVDYKAELKNVLAVNELLRCISADMLIGKHAVANYLGQWERGRILEIDAETTKLTLFDFKTEVVAPNNKVIPSLGIREIKQVLKNQNIVHHLDEKLKEHALASQRNAARTRAEKTLKVVQQLAGEVFPVQVNDLTLTLIQQPIRLKSRPPTNSVQAIQPFTVFRGLKEPTVEFYKSREDTNILDGLAKYSAYGTERKDIALIPICTPELRGEMRELIERLKQGKYKYRGAERTFGTKLTYQSIITAPIAEFEDECRRLLEENRNWIGNRNLNRAFIVYVPEDRFPKTDLNSPYYAIKELLFSSGIPVQMVDTPTLKNPDWKDFNLALNLTAKCGVTPWVLPDALPDADFFVGFSYTQHPDRKIDRLMAFANVFNDYGRWQFYQGNAKTFRYDERRKYYKELVQATMKRLDLKETPSIHFHYSAKFSKEDRQAILEAAQSVRPNGKYTFVWINSSHTVRFYDPSPQTDGSLKRGSYVIGSPNQFYLSTTGYNTYQKALGTPHVLEVNVWTEPINASNPTELNLVAKQLTHLTKLNWASTRSFCGTPITIKYARDIARFASVFLERNDKFELHEVLERTPWFI